MSVNSCEFEAVLSELGKACAANGMFGFSFRVVDGEVSDFGTIRTPPLGPDHAQFVIVRDSDGSRRIADLPSKQPTLFDILRERHERTAP